MAYYQKWQCRHHTMIEFSFFVIGVLTVETIIYVFYIMNYYVHLRAVIKKRHLHDMYPFFKGTLKFNWNRIIRLQRIVPEKFHFVPYFFLFWFLLKIFYALFPLPSTITSHKLWIRNPLFILNVSCFVKNGKIIPNTKIMAAESINLKLWKQYFDCCCGWKASIFSCHPFVICTVHTGSM